MTPMATFGEKDEPTPAEKCGLVTTADLSDTKAPTFGEYPSTTQEVASTPKLDLKSNPIAKTYRTVLRQEITKGPNYAGHYRVAFWGCGSSCAMFAVVDLKTGSVITAREFTSVSGVHLAADDFLKGTASDGWGFRYKKDSSLLVVVGAPDENESRSGAYYFLIQGDGLRLVHTTSVNKNCKTVKPEALTYAAEYSCSPAKKINLDLWSTRTLPSPDQHWRFTSIGPSSSGQTATLYIQNSHSSQKWNIGSIERNGTAFWSEDSKRVFLRDEYAADDTEIRVFDVTGSVPTEIKGLDDRIRRAIFARIPGDETTLWLYYPQVCFAAKDASTIILVADAPVVRLNADSEGKSFSLKLTVNLISLQIVTSGPEAPKFP